MTSAEATRYGILVSLLVHALLFVSWDSHLEMSMPGQSVVTLDVESSRALSREPGGVVLDARMFDPRSANEQRAIEERRRRYFQYIEDVSDAIHARRLQHGQTDLIGLCEVSFAIDPDGCFSDIRLRKTSGNPELDLAALNAVRSASCVVKRPKDIATGEIELTQEIRFQYGLR